MILQSALALARRGFRVFPLAPNAKVPPKGSKWKEVATSDPFDIEFAFVGDENVGVAMGADFIAVDVDAHKGGLETWGLLDLPETLTVRTPRGGLHLIYKSNGKAYQNSVEQLAAGVDVRGDGGYIVGAGSVVDGRRYEIVVDVDPVDVPESLSQRLTERRQSLAATGAVVGERDTSEALERARTLVETYPLASEGQRDAAAYKLAARLYDFGCSLDTVRESLEEWNARLDVPLADEEVEKVAASAERNRQNPVGSDNPTEGFEDIAQAPTDVAETSLFLPASRWVGKEPAPPSFVIENIVPRGFVTYLVSAGGRGKSLLALGMMTSVAAGRTFLGLKTEPGTAAGIFCEDEDDELHRRQKRICRATGIEFDDIFNRIFPTTWVGRGDPVLWSVRQGKDGPTRLFQQVEAAIASMPDLALIIIDNVSFVFGGSEIDRGQVTRYMAALTALAFRNNIAIVLIGHESKSSQSDDVNAASGSTAWLNASRSALKIDKKDENPDLRVLRQIKSNRGPLIPPLTFTVAGGVPAPRESVVDHECLALTRSLMKSLIETGANLSPNSQAPNFAPKRLVSINSSYSSVEYEKALSVMASIGDLAIENYEAKGKAKGTKSQRYRLSEHSDSSATVQICDGSDSSATVGGELSEPIKSAC